MDLADLPFAKGKVHPLSIHEDSVLLVHANDIIQQKRLIPDLVTWGQCFSLYTVVVCSDKNRVPHQYAGIHVPNNTRPVSTSNAFMHGSYMYKNLCQEAAECDTKEWAPLI